jgi:hypothetical protein
VEYGDYNQALDYPFEPGFTGFTAGLLIDCGFVVGYSASWSYSSALRLTSIAVSGGNTTLTFASTGAPVTFVFTVPDGTPPGSVVRTTAAQGVGHGVGYIQVGDIGSAAAGSTVGVVLPARIQNLSGLRVGRINVANRVSTAYPPAWSGEEPYDPSVILPEATGLTGSVVLAGGQFAQVQAVSQTGQVIISPVPAADGGEPPCRDLRVFPEDYDQTDEQGCGGLLFSFNGATASKDTNVLTIAGSRGWTVDKVSAHRLRATLFTQILFSPGYTKIDCP